MKLSLRAAAAEAPGRLALVAPEGSWTYAELARRVEATMAGLLRRGVTGVAALPPAALRGQAVALVGEASVEALVLLLALVELGTPVALVHPRAPESERRRLLAALQPRLVLDPTDARGESDPGIALPPPVPDDARCLAIVPTSGTSGAPRSVVLSRQAFVAAAAASAANLGWRDDDRWLLSLPIAHVGGLSIITRCLAGRRTVVLQPAARFDAAAVAATVEAQHITLLSLVPTTLGRLLDLVPPWRPPDHLRAILVGGAAAGPALLSRAADRDWPVLTTYGLSETCSQVTTQRHGTRQRGELGCGEPVLGMKVRISDGGGIEVRGASLFLGYLEAPAGLSADGWFPTGDLGRLDEQGRLHVLGRRDDVLVSGGENVHPLPVEDVLTAHPAIVEACVFGVADPEWGETVAALLVARDVPPKDADLVAFCRERLAPFQRPRRIAYVTELPRTAAGKVDRRRAAATSAGRLRRLTSA